MTTAADELDGEEEPEKAGKAIVIPHAARLWYPYGMQHVDPAPCTLLLHSPCSPAGSQRVRLGQRSQYSNSRHKAGDVPAELPQGECSYGAQACQATQHVVPMQCRDAL